MNQTNQNFGGHLELWHPPSFHQLSMLKNRLNWIQTTAGARFFCRIQGVYKRLLIKVRAIGRIGRTSNYAPVVCLAETESMSEKNPFSFCVGPHHHCSSVKVIPARLPSASRSNEKHCCRPHRSFQTVSFFMWNRITTLWREVKQMDQSKFIEAFQRILPVLLLRIEIVLPRVGWTSTLKDFGGQLHSSQLLGTPTWNATIRSSWNENRKRDRVGSYSKTATYVT